MFVPSSDQIEYDFLVDLASKRLSDDAYAYAAEREPESHVFFPNSEMDECDRESIRDVGRRDIAAKIRHWRRVLSDHGHPSWTD